MSNVYDLGGLIADKELRELAENPTDLQNATFFSKRAGGKLLYNFAARSWMHYDGTRWQYDNDGVAITLAKQTVREMQRLAAGVTDDQLRLKVGKHALSSQSRRRLEAMVYLAQSDLPTSPDRFDRDPFALNVENGTLDLHSGSLRPHSASDYITNLAPVKFDPSATFARWEQFVREIMQGDDDLIDYLQRFFGLCLTGDVSEHLLAILYGGGANGKSTLIHTMRSNLGDYAATVDAALLLAQREGPSDERPCRYRYFRSHRPCTRAGAALRM